MKNNLKKILRNKLPTRSRYACRWILPGSWRFDFLCWVCA